MATDPTAEVDALLVVSFGGPEGPDDVMPFLRNVTRGRNVPDARLTAVAEQYQLFGGVSPLPAQCRALVGALEDALADRGHRLPVYWGNRNWRPQLADTVATMTADGVRHAAAFVTSAYSSWSGCRQYLDDIEAARRTVGPDAPQIVKLRPFFDHPGFVEPFIDATQAALDRLPAERRAGAELAFTAHSLPVAMAAGCRYEEQLRATAARVAQAVGGARRHDLVFQSRSGPPQVPWLEPDIGDHIERRASDGAAAIVAVPIGFVSDHMEVVFDLDVQAAQRADEVGVAFERAATPGTEPRFVAMILDLLDEYRAGGGVGVCTGSCCPPG